MTASADNPGVIVRPPLLYGVAFIVALVLGWLWPWPIFGVPAARWLGLVVVAVGVAIVSVGRRTMTAAGTNVTVNSVLAGPTRSEGVEKFVADMARTKKTTAAEVEREFFRTVRPSSLLQRFARTDEVAAMVAFVASPLSSATNGAALRVEGGVVSSIF